MYGFASGAAAPPPVVARPSVRIDWRTKLNKAIEGVYAEWRTETVDSMRGPYQRKLYRLADKRRDLWIPGAAVLDRAMASIKFGAQLRITYLGEKHIGETGKTRKEFKVEREEG
jgi:hypothetical protein